MAPQLNVQPGWGLGMYLCPRYIKYSILGVQKRNSGLPKLYLSSYTILKRFALKYLFERQEDTDPLLKCHHQPGFEQAKARNPDINPGLMWLSETQLCKPVCTVTESSN